MLSFLKSRKTVSFMPFDSQSLKISAAPHCFIKAQILAEVSSIVEDVLECYVFDQLGLDNVYPFAEMGFKTASLTVKDILINTFLGKRQIISRIYLKNENAEVVLLVSKEPEDDGKFDFGSFGRIQPEKTVIFEEIFPQCKVQLLENCFSQLWNLYQRINRKDILDQKFIFKMNGFHALFTEPKNQEESYISLENKRLLSENVQSIINGNGGIIDSQDSIGLFGGQHNDASEFMAQIDMIYSEIARILKIPLTRLLGRSPRGFNATGESEMLNYDLTLDRYRSGWLEPFFQQMNIKFEKVAKVDVDYLQKVMQMHSFLNLEVSQKIKDKVQSIGENL